MLMLITFVPAAHHFFLCVLLARFVFSIAPFSFAIEPFPVVHQAAMLTLLWTLKSFKRTALFFPSVIGLLIVVRLVALPKMFSSKVCFAKHFILALLASQNLDPPWPFVRDEGTKLLECKYEKEREEHACFLSAEGTIQEPRGKRNPCETKKERESSIYIELMLSINVRTWTYHRGVRIELGVKSRAVYVVNCKIKAEKCERSKWRSRSTLAT